MLNRRVSPLWRLSVAMTSALGIASMSAALFGEEAAAQNYAQFVREANQNTVSIIAGGPGDTSLEMADDLATVLHCVDGLRIVPMVGRGDANNIYDLLFLRGVDMAIVRADVLDHLAESDTYIDNLRDRIVYIAPLFEQEVHLLAGEDIGSIEDLEGKLVNMGAPGSLALAARRILEAADVQVIESKFDNALALERVVDGGLDAMFVTGGKPLPLFDGLSGVTGLHLVPLTPPDDGVYREASFSYQDYPSLVSAGDTVRTVAVPSVLATYDWPETKDRFAKNELFTRAMFRRTGYLRRPARHPKWQTARIDGTVAGWRRFGPAERILSERLAASRESAATLLADGAENAEAALVEQFERQLEEFGVQPESEAERQLLFEAFQRRIQAEKRE